MLAQRTLLWPWWLRLSHWLVASGVLALWLLSHFWYETDRIHRMLGYAVLTVIALRVVLGCLRSPVSARFYLPRWSAICHHWREAKQGRVTPHMGHNPLGQWAVYLMWGLVAALALTGWLSRTDALWGEDWPVQLHASLSWILMAMVGLHLIAVWWVGRLSGRCLVLQMLHGRIHHRRS